MEFKDETEKEKYIRDRKKTIVNNIYSIHEFDDETKFYTMNINYKNIVKSYKVGFMVDPIIRVNYMFKKHQRSPNNQNLSIYINSLLKNYKRNIWSSTSCQPERCQWYLYSNSTNKTILNKLISLVLDDKIEDCKLYNFDEFIDYISDKDIVVKDDVKNLKQKYRDTYEKELSRVLPTIRKQVSAFDIDLIKFLYQNDYYFFNELTYDQFKYNVDNLAVLRARHISQCRQSAFTIVTPTMGNVNLLRLKHVLKQEKVNYFHIILWDSNRKTMEYNGKVLRPSDLEDESTYCYQFTHPYFTFPNQRNDVWLRGVGSTLTNTPYITFFDDDTWPERNHLDDIMRHMTSSNVDYTYVTRRMWENSEKEIGIDNFEAIGEVNKFGFRLIDNSSLYMNIDTARILSTMFLSNQIYGDDRLTYDYLEKHKRKGNRYDKVLVNHIAKPELVQYFNTNILQT